jgi:hypothetical protein
MGYSCLGSRALTKVLVSDDDDEFRGKTNLIGVLLNTQLQESPADNRMMKCDPQHFPRQRHNRTKGSGYYRCKLMLLVRSMVDKKLEVSRNSGM